jgi:hypothetical protein
MPTVELTGYPQDYGWEPHKPETWTYKFAHLKNPLTLLHYKHYSSAGEPQFDEVPCAAGQRVKIVMVSRFGDVGITDDLLADNGYGARVSLDALCNFHNEEFDAHDYGHV